MFKRKCEENDIDRGDLHVQIHSLGMLDEIWKTSSDGKVEVHDWEYIYQEPRDPFPPGE